MPTRAGIYCRISSDPTGLRAGVERQEVECRALAEREGWEVAAVFVDNDTSAYSGKPRPGYRALLAAMEQGQVDAVVAWHPDRLHRSPLELEGFIDLVARQGTQLATVQTGAWDLTTASGRMVARQLGAVARYESEHRSDRVRAKMKAMAEAGADHGGGSRPFGFEADRVTIREDEAALIRGAVDHVARGGALRAVARDWQARGISTVSGKPWTTQVLRRMLMSARIAGLREHRGTVVAEATWPAIVDRDAWEAARAVLAGRTRRGRPSSYLLTGGLARCGLCGAALVARPRSDGRRSYVCASGPNFKGCGKIRRLADPVEDLVRDMVLGILRGPVLEELADRAGDETEARRVMAEVSGYEARLDALGHAHFVEGTLTADEYARHRTSLLERIEDGRRALAAMPSPVAVPDPAHAREWWDGADTDARRAMVGLVVKRVVFQPARRGLNRFDPRAIEVTPRDD